MTRVESQRDEKDAMVMEKERELTTLKRDRASLESSRERERHQEKEKTLKIRRAHGLLTRSLNPDVLKEETVVDALKELQEMGITKESI